MQRFELSSYDSTAIKEWKTCNRKFFYRMVLGRAPFVGMWEAVFAWGTSIHKFLEVLYSTDDVQKAITVARPLFRSPSHPKFQFQDLERWMRTVATLHKFYEDEKKLGQVRVLETDGHKAIEQPWLLQFPDGNAVGGRYDQVVEWNKRLWVRDWKTTSKQLQWFSGNLKPNDQGIRYLWATSAMQFGMDENGVPNKLIDGILFTAIYNAKTVGPEIQAFPVTWSRDQVATWVKEQQHIHRQIAMSREADIWPMEEANCTFCDYKKVCELPSSSAMENMLKLNYTLSPWDHTKVDQDKV